MVTRRGFLTGMAGILSAGVAPAFVGSKILMPIKTIVQPSFNELLTIDWITNEALRLAHEKAAFIEMVNREYDASFFKGLDSEFDKAVLKIRLPPFGYST